MNKVLFVLGMAFLLIPLGMRMIHKDEQTDFIMTYQEKLERIEDEELLECIVNAEAYNKELYENGTICEEEYHEQLNILGNGVMGSIEIPKIDLNLPIGHGTEENVLASGIGHLKESSLPVGGENTHSILTGHRGLPNAQLFTRLDELEKGDLFLVKVCNKTLGYKVCNVQVVEPDEVEIIQVQEGKDLISLITCTPYGLNTHRLVVTGERAEYQIQQSEQMKAVNKVSKIDLVYIMIPCLFLVAGFVKKARKGRLLLLIAISLFLYPINAEAAGSITLHLSGNKDVSVYCTKVADMNDGRYVLVGEFEESGVEINNLQNAKQMEEAAKTFAKYTKGNNSLQVNVLRQEKLNGLDEGVYLIESADTQEMVVNPILVFIPIWSEEEEMIFDVDVILKSVPKISSPYTGAKSKDELYFSMLTVSGVLIIFFIYSKTKKKSIVF